MKIEKKTNGTIKSVVHNEYLNDEMMTQHRCLSSFTLDKDILIEVVDTKRNFPRLTFNIYGVRFEVFKYLSISIFLICLFVK